MSSGFSLTITPWAGLGSRSVSWRRFCRPILYGRRSLKTQGTAQRRRIPLKSISITMPPEILTTMPANPTGRRQRPRLARTYQHEIELQHRDLELCCFLALDVRLATVSDLFAAFQGDFESLFVLRRRLKALFDAGYLACPPNQKWREATGRGNREK